jgi:hypothetical protein
MHPYHAASFDPPGKSACTRLRQLRLAEGQRIAYVFDFGHEWRVQLTLREIRAADGRAVARCIERVGAAPPQYDEVAIEKEQEHEEARAPRQHTGLAFEEVDAA